MSAVAPFPRTGFWILPAAPVDELVQAVVMADRAGVDEVWIADEGVMRDPLVVLAAAATLTTHILLGIGITTPVLRHPGALGASLASLDELSGGRAMLGLGVGGDLTLRPFGLSAERPVALMRDAVRVARAVIERQSTQGYEVPTHAMPARTVPIHIGSRGEQINRLASREADGVFLSGLTLSDVEAPVSWARSSRQIHIGLYSSVRFRMHTVDDATSLSGSPSEVAAGLQRLIEAVHPDTIGLAFVDGDRISTMVEQGVATFAALRALPEIGLP